MYRTIPIAASFSKSGIRDDWLAAFMMSSILLNPQLIIYSAALGTKALVVRIISCYVCGIAAGLLIRLFYKNGFFKFDGFSEPKSRDTDKNLFLCFVKNLGSAAAFMITGPATKITNLGAVKIVLGIKQFLLYIAFTAVFACLTGLAVNLFIF